MIELTLKDMKRFTFYGVKFVDSTYDEIFNKDRDNDDLSFKFIYDCCLIEA